MQLEPINELIENFSNIHKFCNNDLNKFILLLRKGAYPYEYMDSWERFDETLPDKKAFYSELHLEDITDTMICMFKVIHYCLLMYLKTL